jgi:long-chain acyl-CoA synthetase
VIAIGAEALARVLAAPGGADRWVVRLDAVRGEVPEGVIPGDAFLASGPAAEPSLPARAATDVASVIYTSGTTGAAKGVTLLHGNFLHQLRVLPGPLDVRAGDLFLCMLPPWHCFERIVEYLAVAEGGVLAYTHPRLLKEHLAAVRPTWMATVPRVWEMVLALSGYGRLKARDPERAAKVLRGALGGRLRAGVSGGGRLAEDVDRSYNEAGVPLLVGYGLTESAPVLTVRVPGANRPGTLGRPVAETEVALVDRETGEPVADGVPGVLRARGPQVMAGYWREPELTARVLLPGGWLDTGDIALRGPDGDLEFKGRVKDTIALRGGEKVEPQVLEDRLHGSPFIEQVVVVGQDRKVLGALVVPRREAIEAEGRRRGAPLGGAEVESLLKEECGRLLTVEAGFAVHERIGRVAILEEPFTAENGLLTATLKIRRPAVLERHGARVEALYGGQE